MEGAGLEEKLTQALQEGDPVTAVKTVVNSFEQLAVPPGGPITPSAAATGLEESRSVPGTEGPRTAGLEEDRVSKQEAIRLISENPYKATQVSFDNPVFQYFHTEDWPPEYEIARMLDEIMAVDGNAEALFLSIRQVLGHKTIWVRAASVPPSLSTHHGMLRDKINADGIFHVTLFKDGSVFQLSLPEEKRSFYQIEHVYLLHYDSHDGLYFLHTRTGEIGQYDMKGSQVRSLVPLGQFVGPVNPRAQVSYQERTRLIDALVRAGGVARVEFTEVPLKSLREAVDKGYLGFGTITKPGTATFHLNNGEIIILQVMKDIFSMDHVGSPAGLEEAERRLAIQDQLQAVLRDLTQLGFTYQIVDQDLVKDYPGLAMLSEMHPGIWIDRSQNQAETNQMVADLVSRDVRWVDHYGESESASRFQITAQRALIDVRVPKTMEFELLKQILANLSGLHDPNLLEARLEGMGLTLQRIASWLEQLA